jgi:3-dehydroquinate synthase
VVERILITAGDVTASEILIDPGVIAAPRPAVFLPGSERRRRVAILTQPTVAGRARDIARAIGDAYETGVHVVPDREAAKTFAVVEQTVAWMNSLGLTRHDTIIGIGGGAVTDLAGFVAATYLRGVEAVLVPTTLLGAVDAAIGGKTAVNVDGKNLVGVFRHPSRVVIDTDALASLPRGILREGAAEALKAGLIADVELVELYERHGLDAPLDDVVSRAVRVKAEVVSDDFEEHAGRAILNYGHTIGHGVETVARLPHGHAVAIGMVAAGEVSTQLCGFAENARQRAVIEQLGLPTSAPGVDREAVLRSVALDKKRDEHGLRMVLLEEIGAPIVAPVDPDAVEIGLAAIGLG